MTRSLFFRFLRSLHDRAEPGEEDVVLCLVLDRGDLFDAGFSGRIEDRAVASCRRVGRKGPVAHRRRLESGRFAFRHVRAHGGFGKGQGAAAEKNGAKNDHGNHRANLLHLSLLFGWPATTAGREASRQGLQGRLER